MEISLRVTVPDRPGALAELASAIGAAGADIEAVDVVEVEDGIAYDDLVIVVDDPPHLRALLDDLAALPELTVIHVAPSRGHPGDGVTRLAVGLQAVLSGAMGAEQGVATLAGGLLRADEVRLVGEAEAPRERPGVLCVPFGAQRVVLRRDYAFTRTERERALALARVCEEAVRGALT